ncbi:MAG: hypothetical protein ACYTG0_27255, partial [Planctomycetota bacterium]
MSLKLTPPEIWAGAVVFLSTLGFALPAPAAEVRLFDTRVSSPAPLSGETMADRNRWASLPEGQTGHDFQGDAVLRNDHLTVVLRQDGPGAEVYANRAAGPVLRTVLTPIPGGPDVDLTSLAIVENTPAGAALDATFQTADGQKAVLRYQLGIGQVFVAAEARRGAKGLRVSASSRFVVLPDFFADDIMIDAAEIPVSQADLPSEHFVLHMLPGGEAMVMSVSGSAEEDVRITLSGSGPDRKIEGCEIRFGEEGEIWVALIEGHNVWHVHEVAASDAGKVVPLDWSAPYSAQWRVDWSRADALTDSWELIVEKPNGSYEKHGWFGRPTTIPGNRLRWTTVLGRFPYPCWIDRNGRGHLQPLARHVSFRGPA